MLLLKSRPRKFLTGRADNTIQVMRATAFMQRAYSHGRALTDLLLKVMVDMPTQATLDVLHEVNEARRSLLLHVATAARTLHCILFFCTKHCSSPHSSSAAPKMLGSVCCFRQTNTGRGGTIIQVSTLLVAAVVRQAAVFGVGSSSHY